MKRKLLAFLCALSVTSSAMGINLSNGKWEFDSSIQAIAATSSVDDFLTSGYDTKNMTVYNGTSSTKSFQMNGRTYYQGLTFSGSDRYSYATFNTENINTLSFTIGHVDGTTLAGATLTIYLDDKGEDEISLSSLMNLQDYTLDVSGASSVRFYFDCSNYTNKTYALADFKVDGAALDNSFQVPTYDSSEIFLKSGFNANNVTSYDGTSSTKSFNMNGRTYYQGLVFKGSDRYSYAQFNVEDVDTMSFTIGHVDGTTLAGATLTIYLDGKGEDEIALSSLMNLQEYTLDVSDASVIRFYFDCSNYTDKSYALADFSIDSKSVNKEHDTPLYDSSEGFLKSGFNASNVTSYDGSSKTKSFNMNGRTYYQGLVFKGSDRYSYAQFNVENVDSLSFTIGHVDGTTLAGATLTIYLDGKGEDEIALSSLMGLQEYSLDVSGASVVRFYFDCSNYTDKSYALADFSIDGKKIARQNEIPSYDSPESFLSSGFNASNMTVYDGSSKTKFFEMNGRTYYQGLVFKGSDRYSYAQFNTENVDTLSFTIGHVDNTTLSSATMTIYLDGKGEDEIALSSNMNLMEYTLDVSNTSVVRIYLDCSNYTDKSYALGDISMDSSTSVRPCVIPEYANAEEWLSDRFNTSNVAVYDGSEKTKSFNVNNETYYQGITFKNSDRYSYAKFNTENLSNISFKIGHVDGTTSANSTMTIVVDNKEFDVLTLTADMTPLDYSLDVTDISTVRFYFDGSNYTDKTYALFDVSITEKDETSIMGDVNMDGKFNVSDVVLLQKWLLAVPNTKLADWKAADFCEDGKLDVFDLCMMKRKLING